MQFWGTLRVNLTIYGNLYDEDGISNLWDKVDYLEKNSAGKIV